MNIRPIERKDIQHLKEVLNTIELFPAEYLDNMIADYFDNPDTEHIWFTVTENQIPVSIAYCAPETFAVGTFNLYAIGVRADQQGKGIGAKKLTYLENLLRQAGQRILIIETSSTLEGNLYFYSKCGYNKEAIIRDFWADGDDKVIFWKKL